MHRIVIATLLAILIAISTFTPAASAGGGGGCPSPINLSPRPNAAAVSCTPLLSWSAVPCADHYIVYCMTLGYYEQHSVPGGKTVCAFGVGASGPIPPLALCNWGVTAVDRNGRELPGEPGAFTTIGED